MKYLKPGAFLAALMLTLSTFSGMNPSQVLAAETLPPSAKADAPVHSPDYQIGPEDVLEISVWKNADLSKTVNVRPDGKISLPLIGDVQASGLTPNQLKDAIIKRLKEYQEAAIVSVVVQSVNSYKVFIVGEVRTPGVYQLKSRTSVLQALAMAGGFTQFASKNKIMLVRVKNDGTEERIKVRFDELVYGDDDKMEKNLTLRSGDTILVP